ncbi:unnamed protein product [Gadus morhua 'NCC']
MGSGLHPQDGLNSVVRVRSAQLPRAAAPDQVRTGRTDCQRSELQTGNSERWGCRATSGVCLNLNYIVTQACDRRWPQLGDRRRLLQPGNQSDRRACSGDKGERQTRTDP